MRAFVNTITALPLLALSFALPSCSQDSTVGNSASLSEKASKNESAATIRIGSYNVENMWDDDDNNTPNPYGDFARRSSNWTADQMYNIKAQHVADAVEVAGTPDIMALVELESAQNKTHSLKLLEPYLRKLGYTSFALGEQDPQYPTAVTTAVISKFPIVSNERVDFSFAGDEGSARDPQYVVVDVNGTPVHLIASHWKSKRDDDSRSEQMRIQVAKVIRAHIDEIIQKNPEARVVAVGDFNSSLQDTAMNEGLRLARGTWKPSDRDSEDLYNLWNELPPQKQGSHMYHGEWGTLDNFIVSRSFYLPTGLKIVADSFQVIGRNGGKAAELLMNRDGSAPFRWQTVKEHRGKNDFIRHLGKGYSDHLPIVADFTLAQ